MHFGIEIIPFGDFADPRAVVQIARAAEAAGWEGLWIWDHMVMPYGAGDPWITLAAVAQATESLKLITGVAPLPRYRPHVLARLLTGLDWLSGGRVIFGTGLGIGPDFAPFGEPAGDHPRAALLDEGLDLLTRYWSGEPVTFQGEQYAADGARLMPRPLQQPRIPIWIGGDSPAALRRAARWDGWIIGVIDENSQVTKPPAEIGRQAALIQAQRTAPGPFDVVVDGVSAPGDSTLVREYAHAGATWWCEAIFGLRGTMEELLDRVRAGPPH